ncbi:peptidoglycan editing factor PgeF [Candidatus Poribacteria bacterium]|nr:peptidoglycan editing factor PgeF [Candidatus Poribacteria bacterium]
MTIEKKITWYEKDGIKCLKFSNLELPGIYSHGFTSRLGGVSQGPYASLNLGYFVGDIDKNVAENRNKMRRALNLMQTKMVLADQIHSNKVSIVNEKISNSGWEDPRRTVRMSDALITSVRNVTLIITTADCVPILVYDTKREVIAAIHAGWKGTGLEITKRTIELMMKNFRTQPENCQVAIGPSIGVCCYTVDLKVIDFLRSKFSYWRELFNLEKNVLGKLNLVDANKRQLMGIGIPEQNIASSGICTSCSNDSFFSFRKENGTTGRQMAFICLANK